MQSTDLQNIEGSESDDASHLGTCVSMLPSEETNVMSMGGREVLKRKNIEKKKGSKLAARKENTKFYA